MSFLTLPQDPSSSSFEKNGGEKEYRIGKKCKPSCTHDNKCEATKPSCGVAKKFVKFSADIEYFEPVKKTRASHIWYSREDYWLISVENEKVTRKFRKGKLAEGNNRHTYRGLEKLDEELQFWSIQDVLTEQTRQKSIGINDPKAIAKVYRKGGAAACQNTAAKRGAIDSQILLECISSEYSNLLRVGDFSFHNLDRSASMTKKNQKSSVLKGYGRSLKKLTPKYILRKA